MLTKSYRRFPLLLVFCIFFLRKNSVIEATEIPNEKGVFEKTPSDTKFEGRNGTTRTTYLVTEQQLLINDFGSASVGTISIGESFAVAVYISAARALTSHVFCSGQPLTVGLAAFAQLAPLIEVPPGQVVVVPPSNVKSLTDVPSSNLQVVGLTNRIENPGGSAQPVAATLPIMANSLPPSIVLCHAFGFGSIDGSNSENQLTRQEVKVVDINFCVSAWQIFNPAVTINTDGSMFCAQVSDGSANKICSASFPIVTFCENWDGAKDAESDKKTFNETLVKKETNNGTKILDYHLDHYHLYVLAGVLNYQSIFDCSDTTTAFPPAIFDFVGPAISTVGDGI